MPEDCRGRSSWKGLPLSTDIVQRWADLCRSHPLPVQWHPLRDSPIELREDVPKEVHPVSFLLRCITEHEAHLHLHGAGLFLLSPQTFLLRIRQEFRAKRGEARQCRAGSDSIFIRAVY